ncbi:MAG: hypothetical protein P1U86_19470 [Verrucomicrobiales bacterium]|nr:hypothetical protein [Verrucomicrobiales bacterium]
MKTSRKNVIFSAFAFGLIGLCFVLLFQEVVVSRRLWAEIPRIFGGMLAPIPLALYFGFCFAHRAGKPGKEPSARLMTSILGSTVLLVLGVGSLLSRGTEAGGEIGIGPVITQSAVFSSSVLNLLFLRNTVIASVLGGISIGLTIFVIFLA